jgi:hypothetical protein
MTGKSERFILPVLMQSDLEIPATLVAGKPKCFGFPCLVDRKRRSTRRFVSPFFQIALVLMRFDHVASFIKNANRGIV